MKNKPKVVFITSQGGTHPIHRSYAESISADIQYIDFKLRWHDKKVPFWKKYLSWFVCAFTFPKRSFYDIFLVSGQHFMPVIMKVFGLLRKDQKLVCFHANECLYFMKERKYKTATIFSLRWLLKKYDYHICVGEMQKEMLESYIENPETIFVIENGLDEKSIFELEDPKPVLNNKTIIFIGNLYTGWRFYYKGMDLLLMTLKIISESHQGAELLFIGQYDNNLKSKIVEEYSNVKIKWMGKVNNIKELLLQGSVYLHLGRGDAFPTSVLEAMSAGLIPVVSEWTGTKAVVAKICPDLIVPLDPNISAQKINEIFTLSIEKRQAISELCRNLIYTNYTREISERNFIKTINTIYSN